MARLLMNFRMVPDDEINEVRAMLESHDIAYREQESSNLGFTHGGFWVLDDTQYPRARELLDAYQLERQTRARAEYAEQRAASGVPDYLQALRERPLASLLVLMAIGGVLVVTVAIPYLLLSP